jgi:hypothetical protein
LAGEHPQAPLGAAFVRKPARAAAVAALVSVKSTPGRKSFPANHPDHAEVALLKRQNHAATPI